MIRGHLGRVLLFLGFAILIALFTIEAIADEISIIEVRKNIPLSDSDPTYKDFYIYFNGENQIKKNTVVTATRKITIKDATGSSSLGEIVIPVGQLKIITVQNRIAVAREYKLISREDEPMLDQTGMMIGDKIDLQSTFIDNKKASVKKTE